MTGFRSLGGQGGVETHVANLIEHLDRAGYTVEAIVRSRYAQKPQTGAHTRVTRIWAPRHPLAEALIHTLLAVLYAAWIRPGLVHLHAVGPALLTPLARLLGLCVVVTHHGEDYNREKWGPFARRMLRLGEIFAAYFANQRICISRSLAESLTAHYRGEFRFIPNGVPRHAPVETTTATAKFGLTPGRYILHVGRFVPEKRQLDLVAAFDALGDPDMKLALVGEADHASRYSQQVIAAATGHPQIVLTGFQNGTPLAELFSHAAVFALPSTHEGLPIVLLEAMSYRRSVIASNIEANLNLGLPPPRYFETGNISDLVRAIRYALDHADASTVNDWSMILRDYDWRDVGRRTIDVYASARGSALRPAT